MQTDEVFLKFIVVGEYLQVKITLSLDGIIKFDNHCSCSMNAGLHIMKLSSTLDGAPEYGGSYVQHANLGQCVAGFFLPRL